MIQLKIAYIYIASTCDFGTCSSIKQERLTQAQARLHIYEPEPVLLAYAKYGCRGRLKTKSYISLDKPKFLA